MHYGKFEKGQFHGYGTVLLTNGDSYCANWDNSRVTGQGVYTWVNGIKTRITFNQEEGIIFENLPRLIYPEDDFRMEYRGSVRDMNIMDGNGELMLKDGTIFTGVWANGVSEKHEKKINNFKKVW